MNVRLGGLVLLALLVAGCGGGTVSNHTAPLIRHVDSSKGFELSTPAGWRVAIDASLLITARSADDRRLVAVAPFLAPDTVDAQGCLSRAASTFASTFPRAQLGTTRDVGGSEAVADLSFTESGAPSRAALLCETSGRAGMLYAIAAPRGEFAAARPQLLEILRSFKFQAPASGRTVDAGLRYRSFRDPNEGAFTADVPDGWNVTGGLIRRGATEVYPRLNAAAPGGRMRIFAGLIDPHTYATPNAAGVPEGTELPYAGATLVVSHYIPGDEFARSIAEDHIGCDGVQVLGGGARPGISSSIADAFRAVGVSVSYDIGDVHFACTNQPTRGYVVAATLLADTGAVGTWYVDRVFGYQASAGTEATAQHALARLISSWRTDPDWAARQQQTTVNVSEINRQTNDAISGLISSTEENKQAVDDQVYNDWSNATLGETDVRDPDTGTEYKVTAGHNYYWRELGTDSVVGTDTDSKPDINFTPLTEL